ncbi:MAG: UvrD-helicase domain-containing protein, partial [Pseudomonadota bacterium]
SVDFLTLRDAFQNAYEEEKRRRAVVDFDDLIRLTDELMRNVDAAWVAYKLDQGVDHILVDEAQDTSPAQWSVIESLLSELVSGEGAVARPRSFFAVGDLKQSIYSFQGADAGLFLEKEQELGKRLAAVRRYENVRLALSFRTTAPVLKFVDGVFGDVEAAQGLGEFPIPAHGVHREGEGGLVELWPLTPRPDIEADNPWDAPVDEAAPNDPARRLCERVAATIRGWIDNGEMLASKGRPIQCDDIMILVQSRSRLFHEMIGRLGAAGVPVAGADRLSLTEDPAVEDLMAYARAVATRDDDLSFAALLKSPFFGVDEEALFQLAHPRAKGMSLQTALIEAKNQNARLAPIAGEFDAARLIGMRDGPVAFFSHILEAGSPSGRQRLYARLGETAEDTVNALLHLAHQFELSAPPSLFNFIHWFDQNAGDVKREMDQTEGAVRIMTAHGSKGLEANIVFLLDAHRLANTRDLGPTLSIPADESIGGAAAPLFAVGEGAQSTAAIAARESAKHDAYEEYRRLFYVAATRARDRLYVCGLEQGNQKAPRDRPTAEKSWHSLACDAFDRLNGDLSIEPSPFWDDDGEPIRRLEIRQVAPVETKTVAPEKTHQALPNWARRSPPTEAARMRLAPSRFTGEDDHSATPSLSLSQGDADPDAVFSPQQRDRYFRGRIIHYLLEWAPQLPQAERRAEIDRLVAGRAGDISLEERVAWRDEVLQILEDPEFATVFSANSRAEASIAARLEGDGGAVDIIGRIDRLIVEDDVVLAVDYKSNRPPPKRAEQTPEAYLQQMALYRAALQKIYPGIEIKTALLWTYAPRLVALPDALLDHAFARALQ